MKYLLFAGSRCYPIGGLDDLKGVFDSEEEAWKYLNHITRSAPYYDKIEWFQIVLMDGTGLSVLHTEFGYTVTSEGWCVA